MRPLFILILGMVFCSCAFEHPGNEFHLSGELDNYRDGPIELNFFRDYINNDRKVISIDPDGSGTFDVSFMVVEPVMATLTTARGSLPVFLEPAKALSIHGDARQLPRLSFYGPGGAENSFLAAYREELLETMSRPMINEKVKALDPDAFMEYAENLAAKKLGLMEAFQHQRRLSPAFVDFFQTQVQYEKYQQLLDYPSLHRRLNQMEEEVELPDDYYDFLEQAIETEGEGLNNLDQISFLLNYLTYKRNQTQVSYPEGSSVHVANYYLAGEYLTGSAQDYMQALAISREMNSGDLEQAAELFDRYMGENREEEYQQRLRVEYEKLQRLWKGNPAPDFTMTDMEGNTVSMGDYLGKVVYLKFWASWCGPCMREVPPATELKERMSEEEDLVFFYVSIDTDQQAWEDQVARHGITGIHTRTPGRERGVPAAYHVRWIPTYYVIGRDGNIYDHRPPKPSDERVDEVLKAALEES